MSEQLLGPRDRMLDLTDLALRHDDDLLTGEYDEDEVEVLKDAIEELDAISPYQEHYVTIYGDQWQPIANEENEVIGGHFLRGDEPRKGFYKGLTILYDNVVVGDEVVEAVPRVAHALFLGKVQGSDIRGNWVTTDHMAYFLVRGTSVVPEEMHDCHSFVDLENDEMTARMDEIVYAEDSDLNAKVASLDALLRSGETLAEGEAEMVAQRISYLNSLDLLEGASLLAGLAIARFETFPNDYDTFIPKLGSFLVHQCWAFEYLQEIVLNETCDGAKLGGDYALYIRGYHEQLGEIIVPVSANVYFE